MNDIMLIQAQRRIADETARAERIRARRGAGNRRTSRQDVADRIRHYGDGLDS
jgi:hypothetical protein